MTTLLHQRLRFISRPYRRRVGFVPVTIAIALGWVIAAISFVLATLALRSAVLPGSLATITSAAFTAYLIFATYNWIKQGQQRFELILHGDMISLSSFDVQLRNRTKQEISLSDVESAEYYEPRDVSSILLRGRTRNLEIPLWPFGPQTESQIVSYFRERGVRIIGIPNDVVA